MSKPIVVTITGGAGKIGYSLAFRIAAGELFGEDKQVELRLLDLDTEKIVKNLEGIKLELEDCAFDNLSGVVATTDLKTAFEDSDSVFLVGSRPRTKCMERKDLLQANAAIFKTQGKAINDYSKRSVKVLVVGNPANTNCYTAIRNAPDLDKSCFSAMLRLDHNRSVSLLAKKVACHPKDIRRMIVWGNHSSTQYPDITYCTIGGKPASELVDKAWLNDEFIPVIRNRGAQIIALREVSSTASAANAAICQMKNWVSGTPEGDWVTMGVVSDGSYGIPEGYVYGFPVTCKDGQYNIVTGLDIPADVKDGMLRSFEEIKEEAHATEELLK